MIDTLILGIKDIIKNKRTFFVFFAITFTTSLMLISSVMPLVREFLVEGSRPNLLYSAVPISNDMTSNRSLFKGVNDLLNEEGSSYFESFTATLKMNLPVVIVVDAWVNGTMPKLDDNHPQSFAKLYVKENEGVMDDITLHFPELQIVGSVEKEYVDSRIFDSFHEDQIVVIFLKSNEFDRWVDLEFGLDLISLIEFVSFKYSDHPQESMMRFESLFEDSFLMLKRINESNQEAQFLVSFVYPMILVSLIVMVIGFAIMITSLLRSMYREYTIHLISGATYLNIFLRHSIFIFLLLFVCLMLVSVLNQFKINREFLIVLSYLTTMGLILEGVLLFVLSRKSLLKNVKGDR